MVFTTEGSFQVAIESWPEWDLNPQYAGAQLRILHSRGHFVISCNKDNLINISSTKSERNAPQEEILEFFLLDTLKTAF